MNYKCLSINIVNNVDAPVSEQYGFSKVSFEEYCKCFPDGAFDEPQIRNIYDEIRLPRRMTSKACGYDFFMPYTITLQPNDSIMIPTGIRCKLPPCIALLVYPRSGLGCKYGVQLANTVGVIDPDYYGAENEGHIFIKLTTGGIVKPLALDYPLILCAGDRFCQGILTPFATIPSYDAQFDESMAQRTGGLGSTGE